MSVLVGTGSSRGIGAAVARLGVRRGWSVCVNCFRSVDSAQAVASEIKIAGGQAVVVAADVTSPTEVEDIFEKMRAELSPVTGLVNNAADERSQGPVKNLDANATRRLFEVDALGPFLCTQAAVKQMSTKFGG